MKTTLKKLIEKCWQIIEGVKKTHNKITGKNMGNLSLNLRLSMKMTSKLQFMDACLGKR